MPTNPTGKKARGALFLAIFGLVFFLPGCIIGFLALRMVVGHLNARNWVEAQATIQSVRLENHSDGEGSAFKVTCNYAYIYNGHRYEGSRVGFSIGSDNIDSWQHDTYARLQAARQRNQTVPCYVNPADPSEAVLDRDLRFWMLFFLLIFPTVFGGLGTGLVVAGTSGYLRARRFRQEASAIGVAEDAPWLLNDRWASGVLRPNTAKTAWAVGAAMFWNAIWLPFLLFVPHELSTGDRAALFTLACPLVGLILAAWAIRTVLQKRKFGRSYFECRPLPGVIGRGLTGELALVGDIATLGEVNLTLRCCNKVTTHSGGESTTKTETLWEQRQSLPPPDARFAENEVRAPVAFEIPAFCRPTDDSNQDNQVFWQLLASASAVGVDLGLEFEVPVFRTKDSPPDPGQSDPAASNEPTPEEEQAVAAPVPPESARILCEQDPAGNSVYVTSGWPNARMAMCVLLSAFIFTGAVIFLAVVFHHGDWIAAPFLIVFGLVCLLLWLIFLSFFTNFRLTVTPTALEVRWRFGPFSTLRTIPADQIARFSFKKSASLNNRRWYAVHAESPAGRKFKLADMLDSPTAAKWLIRRLEEAVTVTTDK